MLAPSVNIEKWGPRHNHGVLLLAGHAVAVEAAPLAELQGISAGCAPHELRATTRRLASSRLSARGASLTAPESKFRIEDTRAVRGRARAVRRGCAVVETAIILEVGESASRAAPLPLRPDVRDGEDCRQQDHAEHDHHNSYCFCAALLRLYLPRGSGQLHRLITCRRSHRTLDERTEFIDILRGIDRLFDEALAAHSRGARARHVHDPGAAGAARIAIRRSVVRADWIIDFSTHAAAFVILWLRPDEGAPTSLNELVVLHVALGGALVRKVSPEPFVGVAAQAYGLVQARALPFACDF